MIKHLKIENFRSLKQVELELPEIAYMCGPNGSGKTNFTEALDFLHFAFSRGLSYAVAEKGGFYNMCFRRERRSRSGIRFVLRGTTTTRDIKIDTVVDFTLQTRGQQIRADFYVEAENYSFEMSSAEAVATVRISRSADSYVFTAPDALPPAMKNTFPLLEVFPKFLASAELRPDPLSLLFPSPFQSIFPFADHVENLMGVRVFRINPRTARQAGAPSVLGELGKYGENLPSVLDTFSTRYSELFSRLEDLVKDVIPGLVSLRTRYTASRQMGLFLEEEGFRTPWDAEELSDGTLMIIALFVAILDPRYSCVVIEEPENSLHPWILRRFLAVAEDLPPNKQVLITTQSPFVVALAKPENLFLFERDTGMTHIARAIEREAVLPEMLKRQFMDLGDYWLGGGLGAVPAPDNQRPLFGQEKQGSTGHAERSSE
jgi:predicted ATPase